MIHLPRDCKFAEVYLNLKREFAFPKDKPTDKARRGGQIWEGDLRGQRGAQKPEYPPRWTPHADRVSGCTGGTWEQRTEGWGEIARE